MTIIAFLREISLFFFHLHWPFEEKNAWTFFIEGNGTKNVTLLVTIHLEEIVTELVTF